MDGSFDTLARWTVWANDRIYGSCGQLSAHDYFLTRASAFGSIHNTLNHLLATDRIWLGRLSDEEHNIPSLDHIVCQDFANLRAARLAEDQRFIRIVNIVARGDLDADLRYASMDGKPQRLPMKVVLSHLFIHHAHHRGQVHALLSQTPVAPPALDITYFPQG
jgi:uncharacterized damage-inducible protein DinB